MAHSHISSLLHREPVPNDTREHLVKPKIKTENTVFWT